MSDDCVRGWRIRPRVGVVAVASPLEVGANRASTLLQQAEAALAGPEAPLELVFAGVASTPDQAVAAGRLFHDRRVQVIVVLAASWFEDYLVGDMLEERPVPVILWGVPGMETGSLCGCQQAAQLLKATGRPVEPLFGGVVPGPVADRARRYAAVAALQDQLRRARIGILGQRVQGMTETTAHELALKRLFGPRLVGLDTQLFLQAAERADLAAARQEWAAVKGRVGRLACSEADGLSSLQVAAAMRQAVAEHKLNAVAVGCYPHLMGRVCLAASLLAEEGVPLACEGDVNGALGMLMLAWLSGAAVHNTDLLDPVPEVNAIVFSHCGSGGFSLAGRPEDITLAPVRLMNQGVCCLFPARPGEVTLVNIVPGLDGYTLAAMHGTAIETGMVFPGNPLKVAFARPYEEALAWIAEQGLGHHWMATYGDWRYELRTLAGLVGARFTNWG